MLNNQLLKIKDVAEEKIISDIDKYGWSIMHVFDPTGKLPNFSYSIGMYHSIKSPEVVVYGMDDDDARNLINTIGDFVKKGVIIEFNKPYKTFLEDSWPCIFLPVEQKNYDNHFGFDFWYYKSFNFPVLQCVWSDEKGRFPWEEEFNNKIKHLQVVLGQIP